MQKQHGAGDKQGSSGGIKGTAADNQLLFFLVALSVHFTGERLDALTNSVENGGADECKICYNAVSCDCRISAKLKQQEIKYRGCNTGRHTLR